jgi:hypothetical protein
MDTLPVFPNFVALDLSHKKMLRAIAERFPAYSDFNFVSMFSWDTQGTVGVATLYGNLAVRFSGYTDSTTFLSFIGANKVPETIETLLDYCRKAHIPPCLQLIPQSVIDALSASAHTRYTIQEDRDNHDYILSVKNLSEFGTLYKRKKNAYNRFMRNYSGHFVCKQLDLGSSKIVQQIGKVLADWQRTRGKSDDEVKNEFAAIRKCLKHAKELDVLAYGTFVQDELVGFTLFEMVPGQTAILHFAKANVTFEGVFEHLKHNFAKHLTTMDAKYINYEQDLGVAGMRREKESYKPVDYLKKYTITVQETSP